MKESVFISQDWQTLLSGPVWGGHPFQLAKMESKRAVKTEKE